MSRIGNIIEAEIRSEVTRGWQEGKIGSYFLMDTEFLFWDKIFETDTGDGFITLWV